MSEQALIKAPAVSITVGGKALDQIPDSALIEQAFQDSADRLVLRADAIELIGNDRIYEVAAGVLGDCTKFIRQREEAVTVECAPYKSAVKRITEANGKLLASILAAKVRLNGLINQFAAKKESDRRAEEARQQAEVTRIQRESAELERKRLELEQQQKAAAETGVAPAPAVVEQQQALTLQKATLNTQIAEATKVAAPAKVEGLAVQTKWTFKLLGETEDEQKANLVKIAQAHPDWVEIKIRVRVVEAYAKTNKGESVCIGLGFFEDTKARSA